MLRFRHPFFLFGQDPKNVCLTEKHFLPFEIAILHWFRAEIDGFVSEIFSESTVSISILEKCGNEKGAA